MAEYQRREMHSATCSECGLATEVPFRPTPGKPVYCHACHNAKKTASASGPSRPRFDATCSYCRREFSLPFSPDPSRPIYCRECKEQGNRIMFDADCHGCLRPFQLSFQPDPTRPIYCQRCKDEHRAQQAARKMGFSVPGPKREKSYSRGLGMTTTRSDLWNINLGHGIRVNKGRSRGPYGF